MTRRRTVWVAVGLLALAGQPAWAARTSVHEAAESQEYGRKFGGMLGRGALNVVTSFVDIIVNVVNDTKAGPPLVGTLTGVAKGAGCGVLRLGSGAVDLVTFWVPGFNGFPVSDSYENCVVDEASRAPSGSFLPSRSSVPHVGSVPDTEPMTAEPVPPSLGAGPASGEPPKKRWTK